jgi:hypothetical protein
MANNFVNFLEAEEECRLLGCDTVFLLLEPTFRWNESSLIRVERMNELGTILETDSVPSSQILSILILKALHSSETSVLTRATRRPNPEDGILGYVAET